jgi:hypothetical protein
LYIDASDPVPVSQLLREVHLRQVLEAEVGQRLCTSSCEHAHTKFGKSDHKRRCNVRISAFCFVAIIRSNSWFIRNSTATLARWKQDPGNGEGLVRDRDRQGRQSERVRGSWQERERERESETESETERERERERQRERQRERE